MRSPEAGTSNRFFYGWIVLAVATVAMSLTVVGNGIGLAVVLDPILRDLQVSRSLASAFFTGATLAAAAALPLVGWLLDRFGARSTLVAVSIGFGIACVLMSRAADALSLALALVALRVLGLGALNLTGLHAINQWFIAGRGIAIGIAGASIALLMGVFPALLDVSVAWVGWRGTYLGSAMIIVVGLAPAAWLWMRATPEGVGLHPDGATATTAEPSIAARVARRTRMLWTIIGTDLLVALFVSGLVFHHYDVAATQGVARDVAGSMFLPFGVASAVAILGAGIALRRVTPRAVMVLMLAFAVAALGLSLRLSTALLPAYGVLIGLAQGTKDAVQANAYAHYFGRRELGAIAGVGAGFSLVGAAAGPTLFALVRETLGNYAPVSLAGIALVACAVVPVVMAPDPSPEPPEPSPHPS